MSNSLRPQVLCPWSSPGKNTGVGCHSFLQGIFPTQGLNLGPLHCRWILYLLSHLGSPCLIILPKLYLFNSASSPFFFQILMIYLFNCSNIFQMLSQFLITPHSSSSYILIQRNLKTHMELLSHCQLNLLYIFCSRYQVCCNTSEPAFPFYLLHHPLPIHLMSQ